MDKYIFKTIFINPLKSKNDRITVIENNFDDLSASITVFKTKKYEGFLGISIGGQEENIDDYIRELDTLDYQMVQNNEANLLKKIIQIAKAKDINIAYVNKPENVDVDSETNSVPSPQTMMKYMNDKRVDTDKKSSLKELLDSVASTLITRDNLDLAYDVLKIKEKF